MKTKLLKYSLLIGFSMITLVSGVIIGDKYDISIRSPFRNPLVINKRTPINPFIAEAKEKDNSIILKISHYWPPKGGMNCSNFVDGECVSKMANSEPWQEWVGVGIACPQELDFGTKIKIGERVWECKDRGSRITKEGDIYWVDMLTPYSLYDYGEVVVGEIVEGGE